MNGAQNTCIYMVIKIYKNVWKYTICIKLDMLLKIQIKQNKNKNIKIFTQTMSG